MVYREEWADKILNGRSILDCALDVHMTNTGSLMRGDEEQKLDVRVLINALTTWKPGRTQDERFDNAVRQLLWATLAELTT